MKNILENIKKIKGKNSGEISLGAQILLFLVALFVIWVLVGGNQKVVDDTRILIPITPTQ